MKTGTRFLTWVLLAFLVVVLPVTAATQEEGKEPGSEGIELGPVPGTCAAASAPAAAWPGPDGYGYTGQAITYSWVDITGSGTPITGLADDNYAGPFNIGFSFPFYGQTWTQFYASSNGFLTFGSGNSSYENQCLLPNSDLPDTLIAILWDDLNFNISGAAYYKYYATCPTGPAIDCLVVEYSNAAHFNGSAGSAGTWEAILYENGNVSLQFQDSGTEMGSGSTTGIEGANAPANRGLTYACNSSSSVADGLAIRFGHSAGDILFPPAQSGSGCPGGEVDYGLLACNWTGANRTFTLSYAGNWPISGPGSLYVTLYQCASLTVTVTAPCENGTGTGTVTASGGGYSDSATVTTSSNQSGYWNAENQDVGTLPYTWWGMGYGQTTGKLWLAAGVANDSLTASTYYYNTATGAWASGGNLVSGVVYRNSAAVLSDVFYKLGGSTGSFDYTGLADKYSGGWAQISTEPDSGRMDNVTVGYNGYVWSVTGYGNNASVRRYTPSSNSWSTVGTAPSFGINYARSGCLHGSKVYIYGDTTTLNFSGLWSYNLSSGTWTHESPAGTAPPYSGIWAPAWAHDAETGLCYLTGGATAPGPGNLATVYVYNPVANAWGTPLPGFTTARDFHAAFLFTRPSDGAKLLCVAGGNNGGAGIASTQCYDFEGCPPCGGDEYIYVPFAGQMHDTGEPNNTFAQAWGPLVSNWTYPGYFLVTADMNDYSFFVSPGTHSLDVWLTDIPAGSDYALYLYDSAHTGIGYSDQNDNQPEHIYLENRPAGKYFVRVQRQTGPNTTQPYHLRARFQ